MPNLKIHSYITATSEKRDIDLSTQKTIFLCLAANNLYFYGLENYIFITLEWRHSYRALPPTFCFLDGLNSISTGEMKYEKVFTMMTFPSSCHSVLDILWPVWEKKMLNQSRRLKVYQEAEVVHPDPGFTPAHTAPPGRLVHLLHGSNSNVRHCTVGQSEGDTDPL